MNFGSVTVNGVNSNEGVADTKDFTGILEKRKKDGLQNSAEFDKFLY